MSRRITFSIALISMASPILAVAALSAQPEPMRPVEPDRRRIVNRGNDHDRDRDRDKGRDDGARDRRHGGPGPIGLRPPQQQADGQWVLGVAGDDTEVGVRIRTVVRGSAADRAGFERDDVVINVGGYQVGVVDGRRYDMGEELQRQADRAGRVTMLIQNRRDRSLRNVAVQLEWQPARTAITGAVSYRERIAVPPDAVCFVELHEVDFAGRPLRLMNKQVIRMNGASTVRFDLDYDARSIDPRRRYAVTARIESNGRTWFESRNAYYVLTQGAPDRIDLVLERAGRQVIRRRP